MTALNSITDEGAESLVAFCRRALGEEILPQDRFQACFTLGMLAWRAGDLAEMKEQLSFAAEAAVQALEGCDLADTQQVRTPHDVVSSMFVVMNFGDDAQLRRLGAVKRQQFFQPEAQQYRSLADLLDCLRAYFAGALLDAKTLSAVEAVNEHRETDHLCEPYVGNLALGLSAIQEKNTILADKCFAYLANSHTRRALGGGWENLADGLMSLWALTLATAARRELVSLTAHSPYVPVL